MTAIVDLVGQRFGRLLVLHRTPPAKGVAKVHWVCQCDCGTVRIIDGTSLRRGFSTSCGCFQREDMSRRKTVHGKRRLMPDAVPGSDVRTPKNPTYATWMSMRARCTNPNAAGYQNYGGRGIKTCRQWETFEGFLKDMGPRPDGMSLDRIDADGDYTPANCRWVTPLVQVLNRRDRMPITARIAAIEAIRGGAPDGVVAERFEISLRAVRRMRHGLQTGAAAVDLEVLRGLVAGGAVDDGTVD